MISSKNDDSEQLIAGGAKDCASRYPLFFFMFLKILPFACYFIAFMLLSNTSVALILFFIAQSFEFYMVQSRCGLDLIGIKWYIEPGNDGSLLQFYAKPAPYVPNYQLSNIFWIGFIAATILWVVILFIDLFQRNIFYFGLASFGLAIQVCNFLLFMKAQATTQKAAANIARAGILNDIKFDLVDENDDTKDAELIANSDSASP